MELTYPGDWIEGRNSFGPCYTLYVGDYTAHVYRTRTYPRPGRPDWTWWARLIMPADIDPDDNEDEEIGRGSADDPVPARTTAEATIRQHHTERFTQS